LDYFPVTMGQYTDLINTARNMPDMFFPTTLWASYGGAMRKAVSVPVFVVGRITEPSRAERLLAGGQCDMVVLARALVADAELPVKAFEERIEDIRICVGAQEGCWGRVEQGRAMTCVQNPVTG